MLYEYKCTRCGESFVGDGENTEDHAIRENGLPCYGKGILIAEYR